MITAKTLGPGVYSIGDLSSLEMNGSDLQSSLPPLAEFRIEGKLFVKQ